MRDVHALAQTAPTDAEDYSWMVRFLQPEPWTLDAACQGTDPDAFFPDKNDPGRSTTAAKRICAGCPVVQQCLEYALKNNEKFGVWGGLSEQSRRRFKNGGAK